MAKDKEKASQQKVDGLKREYEALQISTEEVMTKMSNAIEELYEVDDIHIKINCIKCDGKGWVQVQSGKQVCPVCGNKKYMWVKAWKPEVVVKVKN